MAFFMRIFILTVMIGLMSLNGFAQRNTCVCCTEDHQAFDFWEGTWRVTNPDGSYAGTNTIMKVEDGCVLRAMEKCNSGLYWEQYELL